MTLMADLLRRLFLPVFLRAGFTFERSGNIEGWLGRDPYSDDWILWSDKTQQMYRSRDGQNPFWVPSPESREECLKLGRVWKEMRGLN